jgi:hypothetical protein
MTKEPSFFARNFTAKTKMRHQTVSLCERVVGPLGKAWYLPGTNIDFVGCVKFNDMLSRIERETESVQSSTIQQKTFRLPLRFFIQGHTQTETLTAPAIFPPWNDKDGLMRGIAHISGEQRRRH